MVSCGNHEAPTCGYCAGNSSGCYGDCEWSGGKCIELKSKANFEIKRYLFCLNFPEKQQIFSSFVLLQNLKFLQNFSCPTFIQGPTIILFAKFSRTYIYFWSLECAP
jgi:hypothetical protein